MASTRRDNAVRGAAKRPTLRDVAALAGVSFKTVSRVVNGEAGVSAELTARVQRAVGELGYQTDPAASSLRRRDGRTGTIAVVIDDVANPFSASMHRAVEDRAAERGVLVLAGSSDDDRDQERAAIDAFTRRRVDGIVLMPVAAEDTAAGPAPVTGMPPAVAVDRPAPGMDLDAVVVDNRSATARAVAHLLRRGHRRVAFLGDATTIFTARERLRGYQDALDAAGIAADPALVRTELRAAPPAQDATIALLTGPAPPTALLAARNQLTIGAVHALRGLGLHRSVALVSFDDLDLADLLEPGVTVVAQDPAAIGHAAAERLFARIDGDDGPARHVVVPTRLIPRGSGEIPPPAAT